MSPKEFSPPKTDLCEACGRYHGGVNEALICLRSEIRRLRRHIYTLRSMLAKITEQEDLKRRLG
jgi:NMD protein affecting ribosome stability and mRNA decay